MNRAETARGAARMQTQRGVVRSTSSIAIRRLQLNLVGPRFWDDSSVIRKIKCLGREFPVTLAVSVTKKCEKCEKAGIGVFREMRRASAMCPHCANGAGAGRLNRFRSDRDAPGCAQEASRCSTSSLEWRIKC